MVTKAFGPTNLSQADIASLPFWPILPYGAQANLLVPRPEQFRDALAFLKLSPPASHGKMYPAILLTRMSRGTVVYFAYAPEFIVALAFDLAGHCGNDTVNYPNESTAEGPQEAAPLTNQFANIHRVRPQLLIMKRTIDFMLTGN